MIFTLHVYTHFVIQLYTPAGDAYADSVVGTTVACVLLLLLITLMITVGYFILKNIDIKSGAPVVLT